MATLSNVIASLDDKVNVGLMMMDETGAGTTAPTTGSYVRFGVRNMSASNRAWLRNLVLNMGINNDKTNNASWGFAMFEAYKYFGGGSGSPQDATHFGNTAYSGFGQPKRDFAGNPQANTAGGAPGNAFENSVTPDLQQPDRRRLPEELRHLHRQRHAAGRRRRRHPQRGDAARQCRRQHDHHPAVQQHGDRATSPTSTRASCSRADVNSRAGQQNVITYTVAVYDPAHMTGSDPDMIMLMSSMANQGGGRYFAATDANTLQRALETIFTEVQAVNSVFASSTLPVSVNVRGTYLNQVYMGVFRPDADALPRWMGNLKEYRLAVSSADTLFLADVNGDPVEVSVQGGSELPADRVYFPLDSRRSLW